VLSELEGVVVMALSFHPRRRFDSPVSGNARLPSEGSRVGST